MADQKKRGSRTINIPAIVLPPNSDISVTAPQQGMKISEIISDQQLQLLASHLQGVSTGETSQSVIIVPEAVDDSHGNANSVFSQPEVTDNSFNIPGTSFEITVDAPDGTEYSSLVVPEQQIASSSGQSKRGRPTKYMVLENGDIIKKEPTPAKVTVKKPRGRPKMSEPSNAQANTMPETNTDAIVVNEVVTPVATKSKDNGKTPRKQKRRKTVIHSDSDLSENESVEDHTQLEARPLSLRAKRLRRSVVKTTRYSHYEVEDQPVRPENVWIDENGAVDGVIDTNEEASSIPAISSRRGRRSRGRGRGRGRSREEHNEEGTVLKIESQMKNLFAGENYEAINEDDLKITDEEACDIVTCGSCKKTMPRVQYYFHQNNTHNGLSWIENEGTPIDFRDTTIGNQNYLSNLVREAFARKGGVRTQGKGGFRVSGKYLKCEKCPHKVHSASGYLSHFRFCSISHEERLARMWTCPQCNRVMMPSSRYSHESTHLKQSQNEDIREELLAKNVIDMLDSNLPPKRKAAVKAKSFMQELLHDDVDPLKVVFVQKSTKENKSFATLWKKQLKEVGSIKCRFEACNFTSTDVSEMQLHCQELCPLKPSEVFECLYCTLHFSSESSVLAHVKEEHPQNAEIPESENSACDLSGLEESSDNDEDCEEPVPVADQKLTSKKKKGINIAAARQGPAGSTLSVAYSLKCMSAYWAFRSKIPYRPVLKWMLELFARRKNVVLSFPNLKVIPPISVISPDQRKLYEPLTKYSISFCTSQFSQSTPVPEISKTQEWQSIQQFSGMVTGDSLLFFTGGPVSSMVWCPTPLLQGQEQLLAVSCHRSMDSTPHMADTTNHPGLIQLWIMGDLNNLIGVSTKPSLLLGLCHHWGPVRQLSWCPSNCWEPESGLYGLLAAACADGTVRVLPVPKLVGEKEQFIEAKVNLTLVPFSLEHYKNPCLRISWHAGKGHNVIAGGFVDGLVCLWKLGGSSQLLSHAGSTGEEQLYPYLKFQAHTGPVSALELCPFDADIPRFMFTGGLADKNLTYWDLENLGEVSLGLYSRKMRVTSSTWMSEWPSATAGFEDLQSGTMFVPPRNFCKHFMILPQNSSVLSVDKSDWLNGIAQSTVAGEVSLFLCSQVIFGMESEKTNINKRALLTRTCAVNTSENRVISKDDIYLTYDEASVRGLMFCDVPLNSDKPGWSSECRNAQLPEFMDSCSSANYPLTAINKVAWNPNPFSFGWIAAGYQCGIVRIMHVTCKSSDQIIKATLQNITVV